MHTLGVAVEGAVRGREEGLVEEAPASLSAVAAQINRVAPVFRDAQEVCVLKVALEGLAPSTLQLTRGTSLRSTWRSRRQV